MVGTFVHFLPLLVNPQQTYLYVPFPFDILFAFHSLDASSKSMIDSFVLLLVCIVVSIYNVQIRQSILIKIDFVKIDG